MARSHSIPPFVPSEAQQARRSFATASAILSAGNSTTAHKFAAEAAVVRRLARDLATALEDGATLAKIDELAVALGMHCLDVQSRTLSARAHGNR